MLSIGNEGRTTDLMTDLEAVSGHHFIAEKAKIRM